MSLGDRLDGRIRFVIQTGDRSAGFLAVDTQPSLTATNDTAFVVQPKVQLKTGAGVNDATASIVVTARVRVGTGTLGGTLTASTDGTGLATFTNLKITGAIGPQELEFTAPAYSAVRGRPIQLNAAGATVSAAASTAVFTAVPPLVAFDSAGVLVAAQVQEITNIVVTARDAQGNAMGAAGAGETVTVTTPGAETVSVVDNGDGTYTGPWTPLAADNNAAITVQMGGVNVAGGGVLAGRTSPFAVRIRKYSQLILDTQPSGTVEPDTPFPQQPKAQLVDGAGVDATAPGISVTCAIKTGDPALVGTTTIVTDANGEAQFTDLAISGVDGIRTLEFTAPSADGVDAVISANTTVARPDILAIDTQPSAVPTNDTAFPIQPKVQLQDDGGNDLEEQGTVITASKVSGPGTLGGTLTAVTDATGLATFTNLKWTGTVGNYQIAFTSPGLTGVNAAVQAVTAGPAVASTSTASFPGNGLPNEPSNITVQARDVSGNPLTTGGSTVVVTVTGANSVTPTVTDVTDGTYTASYTPTVVGTDLIAITLGGSAIQGSPFTSQIGSLTARAFPGAIGFGAFTSGGRGQTVYHVENRNNSGSGSIRDVADQSNVQIVFDVGGEWNLTQDLTFTGDNVSLNCHSAPPGSGGVTFRGRQVAFRGNNFIGRFFRQRGAPVDGVQIGSTGSNAAVDIILDHFEVSWAATDENISVLTAHRVTMQWGICSKGNANRGQRTGGKKDMDISLPYMWYHSNHIRNPNIGLGNPSTGIIRMDLRYGLDYNWGAEGNRSFKAQAARCPTGVCRTKVNLVGTVSKSGPSTQSGATATIATGDDNSLPNSVDLYHANNLINGVAATNVNIRTTGLTIVGSEAFTPASQYQIATLDEAFVEEMMLQGAGCTFYRDAVRTRLETEWRDGTGSISGSKQSAFPTLPTTGTAHAWIGDMPTLWKNALGGVVGATSSGNGRTYVEMPLNRWGATVHEPIGYTAFCEYAANGALPAEGSDYSQNANGMIRGVCQIPTDMGNGLSIITTDTAAPISHTGVLQFKYADGMNPGSGTHPTLGRLWNFQFWKDSTTFATATQYEKLYVCVWLKIGNATNGFQMPGTVNKLLNGGCGATSGSKVDWGLHMENSVGGQNRQSTFRFEINNQAIPGAAQSDGNQSRNPNVMGDPAVNNDPDDYYVNAGEWFKVEMMMELNSSPSANGGNGSQDGKWYVWVNDIPTHKHDDFVWHNTGSPEGFYVYKCDPTWGGGGASPKDGDDFIWMDHLYLSGVEKAPG